METTASLNNLWSQILALPAADRHWLQDKLNVYENEGSREAPCQYTVEQLERRLSQSMQSYRQGYYCTSDELRKRHAVCE